MPKSEVDALNSTGSSNDTENSPPQTPPQPPVAPDGGFIAWVQCAGSFALVLNSWGIVNSFGVYQTFYEEGFLSHESASNISWIGAIQGSLLCAGGLVSGPLYDYGYLKPLIASGSILVVFGMMMTSICTQYWQLVLAQGIVVGLGMSCLFLPSVAVLPAYFVKHRGLAMGISLAGSSFGGVIYPVVFQQLQPHIGFGWATRVIAFIMLGTLALPVFTLKMRNKPASVRRLFDVTALTEPPFVIFAAVLLLGFIGLYIPFFYIQVYSIQRGFVKSPVVFYLLTLLNAGSFFGRIIPNYISDIIGPLNTLLPSLLAAAVLAFAWIRIYNLAGIAIFCLLFGFFSGNFISLAPSICVTLCPNMGVFGVRLGMIFVPMAIGLLIGNPIAGAVLNHGWVALQAFCGATIIFALLLALALRIAKVGVRLKVKT